MCKVISQTLYKTGKSGYSKYTQTKYGDNMFIDKEGNKL
tara:strand:+ start:175 stop:291 length:117 start_codon:yes stop_codon:yes gene_type:complete